jgi:hypothetical protein
MPITRTEAQVKIQADAWNVRYRPGHPVRYFPISGRGRYEDTRTLTAAYVLDGHTAVVHIESHGRLVALDHLTPLHLPLLTLEGETSHAR